MENLNPKRFTFKYPALTLSFRAEQLSKGENHDPVNERRVGRVNALAKLAVASKLKVGLSKRFNNRCLSSVWKYFDYIIRFLWGKVVHSYSL